MQASSNIFSSLPNQSVKVFAKIGKIVYFISSSYVVFWETLILCNLKLRLLLVCFEHLKKIYKFDIIMQIKSVHKNPTNFIFNVS